MDFSENPRTLEEALDMIDAMRTELRKRPKCVMIREDIPLTIRSSDHIEAGSHGWTIKIEERRGKVTFYKCSNVGTPKEDVTFETHRDATGDVMLSVTSISPRDSSQDAE